MSRETIIAIFGICVSSIFAGFGLFFNYLALKQNNEISISTKLSETSKLLSDELLLQIRLLKYYETEIKVAESRLGDLPDLANKKLAALNQMIEVSLNRQKKIDEETEKINQMLLSSKKLDMGKIDYIISESYRLKTKALHQLEFVKEIKAGTSEVTPSK